MAKKLASLGIESGYTNKARPAAPKSEMTFQERLAMEQQRKDPEPNLP